MKINPKINKQVNNAVSECKKVIVVSIVELMKSIGVESGQDLSLENTLILFENNKGVTKTILCDKIAYQDINRCDPFLIGSKGETAFSSSFCSVDNLLSIYDAVRKIVRAK